MTDSAPEPTFSPFDKLVENCLDHRTPANPEAVASIVFCEVPNQNQIALVRASLKHAFDHDRVYRSKLGAYLAKQPTTIGSASA